MAPAWVQEPQYRGGSFQHDIQEELNKEKIEEVKLSFKQPETKKIAAFKTLDDREKKQIFLEIITQQSSQGYWSTASIIEQVKTVSGLASLNEDKLKEEFASIGLSEDLIQKLVLTVIALWVITRYF